MCFSGLIERLSIFITMSSDSCNSSEHIRPTALSFFNSNFNEKSKIENFFLK